eukprot:6208453-Pleurochrysis_carterae.AAC.3
MMGQNQVANALCMGYMEVESALVVSIWCSLYALQSWRKQDKLVWHQVFEQACYYATSTYSESPLRPPSRICRRFVHHHGYVVLLPTPANIKVVINVESHLDRHANSLAVQCFAQALGEHRLSFCTSALALGAPVASTLRVQRVNTRVHVRARVCVSARVCESLCASNPSSQCVRSRVFTRTCEK